MYDAIVDIIIDTLGPKVIPYEAEEIAQKILDLIALRLYED